MYVANSESGDISVIDSNTNKVVHTIQASNDSNASPDALAFNPTNGNIYGTSTSNSDDGSGNIIVIDNSTNKVIRTIDAGDNMHNLVYNPSNGNMYSTSISNSDGSGKVFVIDSNTDKVLQIVEVGDNPVDIKYNPSNGGIYVVNENSDNVSLIATGKNNSTG
jgi:YVTN family beta-propeller protein